MKEKIKFICVLLASVLISCTNASNQFDGQWRIIKADKDVQDLLDMGLCIEFNIDTENKKFDIYTVIDSERTLQNTGSLSKGSGEYYLTYLPDQEKGNLIYGKMKIKDNQLYYSTGVLQPWVFDKISD